ncbi:hypothetical protein GP486_006507 [Trichoglossum hirsutum]|uniref:Peptide N-acetyl-beta-D-glucosaminyl asparaginase amidase A N-terminal domain-containing protein n=1 Tax=Trichoglossum hirsutum TaxID=265104 RepID=A0A9P8IDF3_9PEZI|nr:hypothetical protein GP486_006507 [Trichoglossum hirsutum]
MGGNGSSGSSRPLTIQAALVRARDPSQEEDPAVTAFLEAVLADIWRKLRAEPNTYILTQDEFAVFNFFVQRYPDDEIASAAINRMKSPNSCSPNQGLCGREGSMVAHSLAGTEGERRSDRAEEKDEFPFNDSLGRPRWFLGEYLILPARNPIVTTRTKQLLLFLALSLLYMCTRFLGGQPSTICEFSSSQLRPPHHPTTASLLKVFQVYQPVFAPSLNASDGAGQTATAPANDGNDCVHTSVLMDHVFAFSYGDPFIGHYLPPTCRFNQVSFNFTVTSQGRQFDRLGLMYLGDTEVFRTSTAEPTYNGIEWTYIKDMSSYLALLKRRQKIIFDLGNLIDDTYTAPFNATLTATFFNRENVITPADVVLPISARLSSSDRPSSFSVPSQNASTTYQFPRNVRRAVATISACGQADEEFWFGNVLSSDVDAFPSSGAPLFGHSPFREVQLLIDGRLAGVAWPFPIIFTGGVVPGLWRPIVGVDAFDLREHEIDISPWLPLLCDGAAAGHTFEIRVAGIEDDGQGHGSLSKKVANYWVVTGKIFLWLDEPGWITRGSPLTTVSPSPRLELSSSVELGPTGANESLTYRVNVARELSVNSIVITSEGLVAASWTQSLSYSNHGKFTARGNVQLTIQNTKGLDASTSGYSRAYEYPVWVNTSYNFDTGSGNFTIDANINRGLDLETWGRSVFPTGLQPFASLPSAKMLFPSLAGSALRTTQNGSAHYEAAPALRLALGHGTTEQGFVFVGLQASAFPAESQDLPTQSNIRNKPSLGHELYRRHVLATNGTVVKDNETLSGQIITNYYLPASQVGDGWRSRGFAGRSVRSILGRGPSEKAT